MGSCGRAHGGRAHGDKAHDGKSDPLQNVGEDEEKF